MIVWHDEKDSFESLGSIPDISIIKSLSKSFPTTGGMICRLYHGIGDGIVFRKDQVKKLKSG